MHIFKEYTLIHINLNHPYEATMIEIPVTDTIVYEPQFYCIVATAEVVVIARSTFVFVWNWTSNAWRTISAFQNNALYLPIECIMDTNHKNIYFFAGYDLFVWNIKSESGYTVGIPSSILQNDAATGITARNNKVYIQGGHAINSKTVVFDINTLQFEQKTVDISQLMFSYRNEYTFNVLLYRSPYRTTRAAVFDDNILLLSQCNAWPNGIKDLFLYFAITEP
eukprot:856908_1